MPKFAYSIRDVCDLTSAGRTAIYAEIKLGRLIARKVGRRTIILESELKAWLAARPVIKEDAVPRS